jgi:thiamine biosynthesis lipoprotein
MRKGGYAAIVTIVFLSCLLFGLASCEPAADPAGFGASAGSADGADSAGEDAGADPGQLGGEPDETAAAAAGDASSARGSSDATPETSDEPVSASTPDLLGTVIRVAAYGITESDISESFEIVRNIDGKMSVNRPDSEISKINDAAGTGGVKVSPETYSLIEASVELSAYTGGTFDPALGGVTSLWKTGSSFGRLPEKTEVEEAIGGAGSAHAALEGGGVVKLTDRRTKLDLGGVATGYACEEAADFLKAKGAKSALLDFGGNIFAFGLKANGEKWTVGIKAPYPEDDGVACALAIDGEAVVTSGYYEKYFEKDGKLYHHILDPQTGYPSDSGLLSATIVASSATKADALSTACFVLGFEKGSELLAKTEGCEGIFITEDGSGNENGNGGVVHVTPGLKGRVRIMDVRFTLEEA